MFHYGFDGNGYGIMAYIKSVGNMRRGGGPGTVPAGIARLAFRATRGDRPRFAPLGPAPSPANVSGIWKAEFVDSDGVSPARGEFHQDPGTTRDTGTFLTPTGDDRYLEGSFENAL